MLQLNYVRDVRSANFLVLAPQNQSQTLLRRLTIQERRIVTRENDVILLVFVIFPT